MNILLLGGLPDEYEGLPLYTSFRNMINADLILHDHELSEQDRLMGVLYQLYGVIPDDLHKAIDGFVWFYHCGKHDDVKKAGNADKRNIKGFDFNQDATLIFSAFYATYNISLSTVEYLHWWEFMALFEGLPEKTLIKQAIYYRTVDISGMTKHERKQVEKMRNIFKLNTPEKEPLTIEEINEQTKRRVAQRIEQAKTIAAERKRQSNDGSL